MGILPIWDDSRGLYQTHKSLTEIAHEAALFLIAIRRNGTQRLYPVKSVPLWTLTEPRAVISRFYSDFGNVCR